MIDGVVVTPLSIIDTDGGDVLHAMKSTDIGYSGYGEAYFSTVESGAVKGWKRHNEMVSNLVVPVGMIRFVLYDDRTNSKTNGEFSEITLSLLNYKRLTIPPKLWLGFQGVDNQTSLLLNIANISHQVNEVDRLDLNGLKYDWSI
jgi:dTDP-4-dehydrorhamnose 3,5-epimerase